METFAPVGLKSDQADSARAGSLPRFDHIAGSAAPYSIPLGLGRAVEVSRCDVMLPRDSGLHLQGTLLIGDESIVVLIRGGHSGSWKVSAVVETSAGVFVREALVCVEAIPPDGPVPSDLSPYAFRDGLSALAEAQFELNQAAAGRTVLIAPTRSKER